MGSKILIEKGNKGNQTIKSLINWGVEMDTEPASCSIHRLPGDHCIGIQTLKWPGKIIAGLERER